MLKRVALLQEELEKATSGGGEKYAERHTSRGRLLPRKRIEQLLDPDSNFIELLPLAGCRDTSEQSGAGIIGGIGTVSGVNCLIIANDPTVKAGALTPLGVTKLERLAVVALENKLPTLYLVESSGADLPQQAQIFLRGGREFRDISRRSRARLPTISVVFGTSTAGGAYIPGMSDYSIFVKNQARVFLAGPPLVKMATGEECDDETLGGAEMHSKVSGVSDFLAENEEHGLSIAREILKWLYSGPCSHPIAEAAMPTYDKEELLGIIPENPRQLFDVREIMGRIVDGSDFFEFKPDYGVTLVTVFSSILNHRVGILGNNGVLESTAACKGAQFIQLCNQRDIPLLFLQNITGFMVGKTVEQGGIIRNGAKLINAVSNSGVPILTLMLNASYGAGNYAMAGRSFDPRYVFGWPSYRVGVMGGAQLSGVMEIIKRDAAKKDGREVSEKEMEKMKKGIEEQMATESDAFFATSRAWDDGLIDPRKTREVLGTALKLIYASGFKGTMEWGVFRH